MKFSSIWKYFLCVLALILGSYGEPLIDIGVYHNQVAMTSALKLLNEAYPNMTYLYDIGESMGGLTLWVIAIAGELPDQHMSLRPEVKYVANMHGNEVTGREFLLHFAEHLLSNYGKDDNVTRLLDNTRIHLMPTMNPDGFEKSHVGECYGEFGRFNLNGVDLNRNFPDFFEEIEGETQKETRAVMDWLKTEHFVLSANLHGGALVASYPLDNLDPAKKILYLSLRDLSPYSACSDDDVFRFLAMTYSAHHGRMRIYYETTRYANFSAEYGFKDGVTNGADWYAVSGGMQDYNYFEAGCFEITLELGSCKYPEPDMIEPLWKENQVPLLELLKQAHRGIKGIVTDTLDDSAIFNASVRVVDRNVPQRTTKLGEFWLILLPGRYTIEVSKPGFRSELRAVEVPPELYKTVRLDVQLYNGAFGLLPSNLILLTVSVVPNLLPLKLLT
ncbi:Carboxypeptidase M [Holothuria leucospilota]|uniref:Carboxypeptidase M n=1 Tax=Holothuria leucospilota TaxID=206669 RepID=A0A9Q1BBU8_HOLLE|nr:Carboxypeptidase M [Holothuria leucospilota]